MILIFYKKQRVGLILKLKAPISRSIKIGALIVSLKLSLVLINYNFLLSSLYTRRLCFKFVTINLNYF